ncbi:calcineurin-like phosphoesterase family protein [Algoriphagus ratkowskyi]|uniref:Calcineurin-like phosphoesterase family protein n=1 Tax=Algoriphagus ratkowskyi TaxID=57028 RepID=A0A2W7R5F3_9BACT|nr:metallophosphoesterase family protein [Algoriphagus ratkowskyi]PZX56068.1 calcineurin-like phosphoesterase family protein [Algoriphagus ratkowskyi]TXD77127.1 metallophosphoesterase family protein [Algoriphagus ratkowskyi]
MKVFTKFNCLFALFFLATSFNLIAQTFLPTTFPDRIILTWSDDPMTTQSVTWRTSAEVMDSKAQFILAPNTPIYLEEVQTFDAKTEFLDVDSVQANYHSVTFQNLKPATTYAYRVGKEETWSEWHQFTTAPEKGAPFSFVYFGDAQNNLKSQWSRIIRQAYSNLPKAAFMLHAGDLINSTQDDSEWGEWNYAGSFINAMIPSIATPGNHEYDREEGGTLVLDYHWKKQFTFPENGPKEFEETVYYTDYSDMRLISLNSQEIVSDENSMAIQKDWLEKVLSENTQKWTIITFHHPIYSSGTGRDNQEFREAFKPIFEKYKVDLVLQGHDHSYGRGRNLPSGVANQDEAAQGPVYVVSVSGPKMYNLTFDKWMDRAASNTQLYQLISIEGNSLNYGAYTATGELYDAFELIKDEGKPKEFIDRADKAIQEAIELTPGSDKKMTAEEMAEYMRTYKKDN